MRHVVPEPVRATILPAYLRVIALTKDLDEAKAAARLASEVYRKTAALGAGWGFVRYDDASGELYYEHADPPDEDAKEAKEAKEVEEAPA